MDKTLLQKAKEIVTAPRFLTQLPEGSEELAVGFMNGEVNLDQVRQVLGFKKGGNTYARICQALRTGVRNGKVTIKYQPNK